MNKITGITPVEKGAEYLIQTELGKYTVTAADYGRLGVSVGDEADEALTDALESCDRKLKCIKKAFNYLSYGDMSQKKLYTKLTKHFDKKLSSFVAALMVQRGYIRENEQALYMARELYNGSRLGKMRIKAKLYQHMFCSEAISYAIDNLGADDESDFENISALLNKKYGDKEFSREEKQKAVEYLVRMGYTYDSIKNYFYSIYG